MKAIIFTIILALFFGLISNDVIYFDEIKMNSINTFENLNKENIYYMVFPGKNLEKFYFCIKTKNTNNDVFKSIKMVEFLEYSQREKGFIPKDDIEINSKKINGELVIYFTDYLSFLNAKYLSIELELNYDLTYLNLTIVNNNIINLSYNEFDSRNLFSFIPYSYYVNVTKGDYLIFNISTKYISNKPFETYNISEPFSLDSFIEPTVKSAYFILNDTQYVFSIIYKIQYYSENHFIKLDFISEYDLNDFQEKANIVEDITILGLSIFTFSFIIVAFIFFIAAMIIIIIFSIKKRKSNTDRKEEAS